METIDIKTDSKTYRVLAGKGALHELPGLIEKKFPQAGTILIVTDENVAPLYLELVKKTVEKTGRQVEAFIAPGGEQAKTFDVFYQCQSFALQHKLNRKSLILALGGGAVGDLAGFAAATYMRGIPFMQIPTTLLAHDSAVGGKTAINHPAGKNMIGVFYQPEAVVYDLDFLASLPAKEIRSGFSEVIKHALIQDPEFYDQLKSTIKDLRTVTDEQYMKMIKRGIEIKASIVEKDEKEKGVRAFLNFGHTLGHAVEAAAGYGTYTHGEAVMIGMIFALRLSIKKAQLDFDLNGFTNWAAQLGYQTEFPELDKKELLNRMKQDKKNTSGKVAFVLLKRVGSPFSIQISDEELLAEMDVMKKETWQK